MVQIKVVREVKNGKPCVKVEGELDGKKHELISELIMGVNDACEEMCLSDKEKQALVACLELALFVF